MRVGGQILYVFETHDIGQTPSSLERYLVGQIFAFEAPLGGLGATYDVHLRLIGKLVGCLLYTSPSPRDGLLSRMPSSA